MLMSHDGKQVSFFLSLSSSVIIDCPLYWFFSYVSEETIPSVIGAIWPNSNCHNRTVKTRPLLYTRYVIYLLFIFIILCVLSLFWILQSEEWYCISNSMSSEGLALLYPQRVLSLLVGCGYNYTMMLFTVTFRQESHAYKIILLIIHSYCSKIFWLFQDHGGNWEEDKNNQVL